MSPEIINRRARICLCNNKFNRIKQNHFILSACLVYGFDSIMNNIFNTIHCYLIFLENMAKVIIGRKLSRLNLNRKVPSGALQCNFFLFSAECLKFNNVMCDGKN